MGFLCDCSDSSEDKQTKPKGKDGLKAENGSPGGASRQARDYPSGIHSFVNQLV